jgi:hypothetical protein
VSRFRPERLQTRFLSSTTAEGPVIPRRYTLTHSDMTGDLFLSVGPDYDRHQISGWYTRLMRDQVLAEWREDNAGPSLHLHCHVSGRLVFGSAGWRYAIFRRELPLVLEALRHADWALFAAHPELDGAPILIHFHARQRRYHHVQRWGTPGDYQISNPP